MKPSGISLMTDRKGSVRHKLWNWLAVGLAADWWLMVTMTMSQRLRGLVCSEPWLGSRETSEE